MTNEVRYPTLADALDATGVADEGELAAAANIQRCDVCGAFVNEATIHWYGNTDKGPFVRRCRRCQSPTPDYEHNMTGDVRLTQRFKRRAARRVQRITADAARRISQREADAAQRSAAEDSSKEA